MTDPIDEIIWDDETILHPGMDYHDGTTYFTVPLRRNVLLPAKKKDDEPRLAQIMSTFVITSQKQGIWYDEALLSHGFVESPQLMQETESRWSRDSVRSYLKNGLVGPSSADLFARLRDIYTKYVEFSDEIYYDVMALYIMYTYVFRLFESTGYIHFNGTMASGKSRNLSILNALAFNTVWASSMSAPALYRKLAGSPGTTCIDESEGFDGERGEELRRILNAGYREGSKVHRVEKNAQERWSPVTYDVFGPKALASIKPLEQVIASRCIIVTMRPAVRELPDFTQSNPEWVAVRDELYLWALGNTDAINNLLQEWKDGKKERLAPRLLGRQWETSEQSIVLADYVGGERLVTSIIAFFNDYFKKQQEAADATDRLRTSLRCLPRVLATKQSHPGDFYSVKDIHEVISSYMEDDAKEYFKTRHATTNLTSLGFTTRLRAKGGLQIKLVETEVRRELVQRRVEPFPEDMDWYEKKTSYQTPTTLFDTKPERVSEEIEAWWNNDTDDPYPMEIHDENQTDDAPQESDTNQSKTGNTGFTITRRTP